MEARFPRSKHAGLVIVARSHAGAWSCPRGSIARMSDIRHEQPVGHARLEVLQDRGLALRHRDRQHLTLGGPELYHVGTVGLEPKIMMRFLPSVIVPNLHLPPLFTAAQTRFFDFSQSREWVIGKAL
jgi:hypothetical protein